MRNEHHLCAVEKKIPSRCYTASVCVPFSVVMQQLVFMTVNQIHILKRTGIILENTNLVC